jgi:hypothetical protein
VTRGKTEPPEASGDEQTQAIAREIVALAYRAGTERAQAGWLARSLRRSERAFRRESAELIAGLPRNSLEKVLRATEAACYQLGGNSMLVGWRKNVASQIDRMDAIGEVPPPSGRGLTPYTLSTLEDAREVAAQIQERVDRLLDEGAAFVSKNQSHAVRAVMKRVHQERLYGAQASYDPVDRLKVYDAECDLLDEERLAARLPELTGESVDRRKRALRRACNYAHILTDHTSGPEKRAQEWLTRMKLTGDGPKRN